MSGVFGVVAPKRQIDADILASQMAVVMSHRDWFVAERYVDSEYNIALGRIGIGIFNKESQPIWNANHTVALAMAGEFYNQAELRLNGISAIQSDEELALTLYEQKGDTFASLLNGAFIIAIWDKAHQKLIITNDRFGLYPLFYTCYAGRLIFAPEMKGILCDDKFPRKLDVTALAQYMRFQHLLGNRTFFEDIVLLSNASVLVYDLATTSHNVKSYWNFSDIPYNPQISFEEAVSEAGRLLRLAVQRLSGDAHRPGVYLSGGLDSRIILGLVEQRPVTSVTYGAKDCRDVYYARQITKTVGSHHYWFDLPDGNWIKEHADFHLTLTEGFHSWIHAHGMSTLAQARQLMDVNLTGWDGGTIMAYSENPDYMQFSIVDDSILITNLFHLFNQKYTWPGITEAEESLLYTDLFRRKIQGLAFDSFRAELEPYLGYRSDVRMEYFYIRNHCSRLTHNFITFTRSHIEVRFPFFDYDLFDFIYSIPAPLRAYRKLYRAVIQQETPHLACIPYDKDELLPTTQPVAYAVHAATVKFKRRFNRHLWPLFPNRFTLYADYENYLRYELREWAENILFDRCTAERGIFNPAFLRTLMNRHLSGLETEFIGKIAPIITFEMMMRRFFDQIAE